jgi:hydrogenase maturation protease
MDINDTIVIGVGNPWRGDDGVATEIIQRLSAKEHLPCIFYDGGTDALALLDLIPQYGKAIIIDAVTMGAAPGTVRVFSPAEAKINIQGDALSTHGFGLAELLHFIEELSIKTEIVIVGIEPEKIDFGLGLSAVVAGKVEEVMAKVIKLI